MGNLFKGRLEKSMKASISMAILCMSTSAVYAQSVSKQVLASWDSQYRPRGDTPALHNGTVAFLGDQAGPDPTRWAVFRGPLNASVPFAPIAFGHMTSGDLVPWRTDGSRFAGFYNPMVWGDSVFFDADRTIDGIQVFGVGAVVSNPSGYSFFAPTTFGGRPSPGALGLVYPNAFRYYNHSIVYPISRNAALPGGGTSPITVAGQLDSVYEGYAYGGDRTVHTIRVNSPFGYRYGIYAWNPASPLLTMVVNPWTFIPGANTRFNVYTGVDTDGTNVSFFGYSGFLGQGAIGGIYTAPIDGGPLTTIATLGQMSPAGLPYFTLGTTAINGDTVFFDASLGTGPATHYAVFAACRGQVSLVYKTGDVINGKVMLDGRVNRNGGDGNDLVMWARYQLPGGPGGVGVMLLHVHIDCMAACRADFNSDDVVDFFDYLDFVEAFSSGAVSADFNSDGVVDFFDYLDFVSEFSNGC